MCWKIRELDSLNNFGGLQRGCGCDAFRGPTELSAATAPRQQAQASALFPILPSKTLCEAAPFTFSLLIRELNSRCLLQLFLLRRAQRGRAQPVGAPLPMKRKRWSRQPVQAAAAAPKTRTPWHQLEKRTRTPREPVEFPVYRLRIRIFNNFLLF